MALTARGAALALALLGAHAPMNARAVRRVTYTADRSDFANPERGFSRSKGSAAAARAAGMSLVHVYFRLDGFRSSALPQSFLDHVQRRFAEARASGVKIVPRFTYNFPNGEPDAGVDRDAPLDRVLQHLGQLAPFLRDNADVIAFMEAGFVGAWGEWHHSTSGLDEPGPKRAILMRLLQILPPERDVVLRYERDKSAIFGRAAPIGPQEAFTGTPLARVGHHNDCFLASADDMGTYQPSDERSIAAAKSFLAAENRYVPQGGETCSAGPVAQSFIGCKNALTEVESQHWSQLNSDYHKGVLERWKREGCYPEISKRLGYRLRLLRSSYQAIVERGGLLRGTITLVNEGFAAPYNPRELELVLRSSRGREVRLTIAADPRRWQPGAPITLNLALRLPERMVAGSYEASLALPDPEPRLHSRPEYAIRLADREVWRAATGDNDLNWKLEVR